MPESADYPDSVSGLIETQALQDGIDPCQGNVSSCAITTTLLPHQAYLIKMDCSDDMKALFFLRHYNDIDHITPVITKWVEAGHRCDVVLIGFRQYRNDFRINFLSKLPGVRVAHLREVLPLSEYVIWRIQSFLVLNSLRNSPIGGLVNLLSAMWPHHRRLKIWRSTAARLLQRSFQYSGKGVVTFDWVERNSSVPIEWIRTVVECARGMDLGTVSLPHGDSPHANQLIRRTELHPGSDSVFATAGIFDRVVVPNEFCASRYRPYLQGERIAVLGSARYCDEWQTVLREILPPSPLVQTENQLKVILFLRRRNFTTFWEEVGLVIRMICSFPGTELMIKPHTRGGWLQFLTKDPSLRRLPNVSIAGGELHSAQLVNWADVVVDLATSAAFEAVKLGKPVLAADYMHAGRSVLSQYMPETTLLCRDDVYWRLDELVRLGCDSFYIEKHRQRFIDEVINAGSPEVLSRYTELLENLCSPPGHGISITYRSTDSQNYGVREAKGRPI